MPAICETRRLKRPTFAPPCVQSPRGRSRCNAATCYPSVANGLSFATFARRSAFSASLFAFANRVRSFFSFVRRARRRAISRPRSTRPMADPVYSTISRFIRPQSGQHRPQILDPPPHPVKCPLQRQLRMGSARASLIDADSRWHAQTIGMGAANVTHVCHVHVRTCPLGTRQFRGEPASRESSRWRVMPVQD